MNKLLSVTHPDACVTLGKIVAAHGIHGYVKVHCEPETVEVFTAGLPVLLMRSGHSDYTPATVKDVKLHGQALLLLFENTLDRTGAELLRGTDILVEKSRLPELEADTYYWSDIVGMTVLSTDGHCLGTVISIFETGSNDVYVVQTPESKEILLPAIASVILEIDVSQKTLRVDIPEGL